MSCVSSLVAQDKAVTLETKCWEGDWRFLLKTDHLQTLADRNCFGFAQKVLIINNVKDYVEVCDHAQLAVDRGWITRYVVVKDHIEEALSYFQLSRDSLGKGYVYSAAELVSIFVCDTVFLLHFAGDCLPVKPCNWVPAATAYLAENRQVKVANLCWNSRFDEAQAESILQTDDFFVGLGFSDQCYLIHTSDFRAPIYNEANEASQRYPRYGGELFEKRVDAWMRNNQHLRATFKHGSYIHPVVFSR